MYHKLNNSNWKMMKSCISKFFPVVRPLYNSYCHSEFNPLNTYLLIYKCEIVREETYLSFLGELYILLKHSNFCAFPSLSYKFLYIVLPELYGKVYKIDR